MQNKIIFREMLSELKALADQKGNSLTTDEVRTFFGNAGLNEEQFGYIYEYLASQKIKVEGYTPQAGILEETVRQGEQEGQKTAGPDETQETAGDFLQMYLEDLQGIRHLSEEEEQELFSRAAAGEKEAKNRLAEQYLNMVYELSMTYAGAGLLQEDLIQEGNMGLLSALEQIEEMESLEAYRIWIFGKVQDAMEAALEISRDTRDMDEEIAGRVNHLNEAILNLEQDLGHKVSVEELSAYLEMPLEEILDILRMAGDEMKSK